MAPLSAALFAPCAFHLPTPRRRVRPFRSIPAPCALSFSPKSPVSQVSFNNSSASSSVRYLLSKSWRK